MKLFFSILSLLCLSSVYCQEDENYDYSNCERQTTCSSCFMEHSKCAWCEDVAFHIGSGPFPPCSSPNRLIEFGCDRKFIKTQKNPKTIVVEAKPFTDVVNENDTHPIQITPQRTSVLFSPFKTQSFEFEYRPAKDYPLDMYVLLDLTYSMKDDKETLLKLNENILEVLNNLTKHVRLGFGGFCDKPVMPYISPQENHRENPCGLVNDVCEKPFDFNHKLNFTTNLKTFIRAVNDSSITANLDDADGVFDALMQILVCGDQIGWNPMSRKTVLIITDSRPHFAGDGKLGGATKMNDKKCHLDKNGYYDKAEEMDYPSLEQIYRVLLEKRISLIFAVVDHYKPLYMEIDKLLSGNSFVGRLEEDSSNILTLMKQGYEKIVNTVNFEISEDEDIDFEFYSNCGRADRPFIQASKCYNVEIGNIYKFRVEMKLKENRRHSLSNKKREIYLSESQLGRKLLIVEVEMTTDCSCSNNNESSAFCSANAEFNCGKCVCLPGWSGKDCDCNKEREGSFRHTSNCIKPNTKMICSGNGECICDACECDEGWTGQHCGCRECPRNPNTGEECNSPNKGFCSCGKCICKEGWSGEACACSDSTCKSPWSQNDYCSGNGVCRCGICKCTERDGRNFTGKYCETCATCLNPACSLYDNCVLQELKLKTSESNPCILNGETFIPTMIPEEYISLDSNVGECIIKIEDDLSKDKDCTYTYIYKVRKDWNTELRIYPKSCGGIFQKAGVLIYGPIVVAFGLAVLAVLCWKFYDGCNYRREYKKFMAEQNIAMSGLTNTGNPLYISPVMEFRVPENYVREKDD